MIRKIGDTSVSYKYTSRYVLKAGQTVTVSELTHHLVLFILITAKIVVTKTKTTFQMRKKHFRNAKGFKMPLC